MANKQYELNESEILWLVAEGYSLAVADDTGFELKEENKKLLIQRCREKFIEAAKSVIPVPFP